MFRVDHNTLLRQKGKFARVCLNIDISKPLSSTLRILTPSHKLSIPLIYDGLHEVCALCGNNAHTLDTWLLVSSRVVGQQCSKSWFFLRHLSLHAWLPSILHLGLPHDRIVVHRPS